MKPTGNERAKGKIRVLRLERETLRELDAAELKHAQGGPGFTKNGFTCRCTAQGHCNNSKRC